MVQLKACLYNGGNISAYVRDLTIGDRRPFQVLPSCTCGSAKVEVIYQDKEREIEVADESRVITMTGVPFSKCKECGKVLGNMKLAKTLALVVDDIIQTSLNMHQPIPETLAFNELAGL